MGCIPIPVSIAKPVQIHTRGPWVRVLVGTGMDDQIFTHGLPVSNTTNIARTVQDFHTAGLPIWFIRPKKSWDAPISEVLVMPL